MPILAPECALFPDDLLDHDHFDRLPGRWHILQTKPRQEKAVARALMAQNIPFYLPLAKKRSITGGRVRHSHTPVYHGYMFLCDQDKSREHADSDYGRELTAAKMTNRIVNILPADDQRRLHHELHEMAKLIATDAPLTMERRIESGEYVRVKGGVFDGHEGYVVKRHSDLHLIVMVTSFQGGISTKLDDCRLESLHREPIGLSVGSGGVYGRGTIEL